MADAFISYARTDKALVAPLVAAIEACGWTVWWDPAIAPGQEFDGRIDAKLDNMSMRYNLACDLVTHVRDFDMALEMLLPVCARMGRERLEWLRSDPDLGPIREDPRFQALVAEAE